MSSILPQTTTHTSTVTATRSIRIRISTISHAARYRQGANQTDLGLRIRYEFIRKIAPYIGVTWVRKYGESADIARSEGEPGDTLSGA